MVNASWLIQVYQMSDVPAQESAVDLLSSISTLTVDVRTCEFGAFLAVECSEITDALHVYELVVMVDPDAELIHSTAGSSEEQTVRARMGREYDSPSRSGRDLLDA